MGKAKSRKIRDFHRALEYQRKQEILKQQALETQTQLAIDYILSNSEIARKNHNYQLTEKVFKGTPEQLKTILSAEQNSLEINPDNFPEGLVMDYDFIKLTFSQ